MTQARVNIADNYEDLCENVTREILGLSNARISAQDMFTIVLSGGSTPKGVYQCMASAPYRNKFQWDKIHFFWSDERWVPSSDVKSNFRMVSQTLLEKIKIPPENIHPIKKNDEAIKDVAYSYEEKMVEFFKLRKNAFPRFDLILLGLGPDGHTASLFPGNPALWVTDRLVVAVAQEGIPEERITLTFPVLNQADMVFFLVSGKEKASIVHDVLEGTNKDTFPAGKICPSQGKVLWFLDHAALPS